MPVYSRNLLLFVILATAAVLTWMLARNTEQEPNRRSDNRPDAPEGYYMQGAVLYGTDDDGQVAFRVEAERLEQQTSESVFSLEEVRVEYRAESGVAWRLNAARGEMTADREHIVLQSVQLRAAVSRTGKTLVFDTRDLSVDLVAETATTSQDVQMRNGQCESNARGLNVDLRNDTYEFPEIVTICRPRSRPVIAAALLAGAAVAQDGPSGEAYSSACFPWAGDLITDRVVCENLVITRGDSFRLTAGQAIANDGVVLTTMEDSQWQLTEGVSLQFETAVMLADSAKFSFDAAGELESFDLAGTPVELSDYIEGRPNPFRIRGERIVYSVESGTLKMPGQMELIEDGNEDNGAFGCDLTYWFVEKRWSFGNDVCGGQFSLTPEETEDSDPETPDEP